MFLPDHRVAMRLAEEQRKHRLQEAESHRLLCQAGIARRGWLPGLLRRSLARVGRLLVVLGRWLERYEAPSPRFHSISTERSGGCIMRYDRAN